MSIYKNGDKILNSITAVEEAKVKEIAKEVYSTNETVIGTWIDGKPLYRKVIDFGALPNTNVKDVPHGISNVENVIRQYGYVKYHDGVMQTLPHSNTLIEGNIMLYADATNVSIKTGRDRSNGKGIVVLEYTKTA